jgi:hypothetical protein
MAQADLLVGGEAYGRWHPDPYVARAAVVDHVDDLVAQHLGGDDPGGDGPVGAGRGHLERLRSYAGDERAVARQAVGRGEDEAAGAAEGTFGHLHLDQVHRRRADERGAEQARGPVVDLERGADLLHPSLVQDRDPVPERHRLDLVVGDVDHRGPELGLQVLDLGAHVRTQLRVEVRQRLVHQEGLRPADEGAGQGDALLLAAREALRLAVEQSLELHHPRDLGHPFPDLLLGLALGSEREGEVVAGPEVRVERVELEDHGDVALRRRQVVDERPTDADVARGLPLQACHRAQGRRLAAPGRPEHHEQLAVADRQVHVLHRDGAVGVALVQ